jgi:hypothetical protein
MKKLQLTKGLAKTVTGQALPLKLCEEGAERCSVGI